MIEIAVLIFRILIAILLYSFLAIALYTLWRDQQFIIQGNSLASIPPLAIHVQDQEDVRFFSAALVTIGRAADCDCILPSETISQHHLRLTFHHNHWWAEDLQSTNGTWLNQIPLKTPAILTAGDILQLGSERLTITISPFQSSIHSQVKGDKNDQ